MGVTLTRGTDKIGAPESGAKNNLEMAPWEMTAAAAFLLYQVLEKELTGFEYPPERCETADA
jgi:hypothetical protein